MNIHPLNVLDGLIIITLGWNLIRGFNKGFVEEILSLVGIFISLGLSFVFSHPAANILIPNPDTTTVAITGIFIYLIFFLIFKYIAYVINQKLAQTSLGLINNILGFLFGIFRGYIIAALIVLGISTLAPNSYLVKRSYLGGMVVPVIDKALSFMPPSPRKKIEEHWKIAKNFLIKNFENWKEKKKKQG